MNETLVRIIQVGLGQWGQDWATSFLPTVPDVTVVGHVDTNPKAFAAITASSAGSPAACFTTLAEAIAATDPDAVLVTTDVSAHYPVVREALLAGKNVLVEKPFALTMEQARSLVATADDAGLTLMVSQNYRFFPAVRAAQRLVADGELGRLLAIDVDFRRRGGAPPMVTPDPARRRDSQPLLRDMSIHHFDLMRAIIGRDATSVNFRTWLPDKPYFAGPMTAAGLIDFAGGVVVSYRGTFASVHEQTAWSGKWRMEFDRGEVRWTCRGEPDTVRLVTGEGAEQPIELPTVSRTDRSGSVAEFVSSIRARRGPETAGADNLSTFAICCAAIESAHTRTPVELAPTTLRIDDQAVDQEER